MAETSGEIPGGGTWEDQYGERDWGNARIRREFLRGTLDGRYPYDEFYDNFRLHPYQVVADIGCGDGDDELYLRIERGHKGPLIGVEVPPSELTLTGIQDDTRFAVSNHLIDEYGIDNIHYLYGYLQSIPLPDKYADRTMALWSLIHVPEQDIPISLSELERVTKRGGRVGIGSNDYGHTPRKHKIVTEIGEILDIETPGPFSGHFRLSDVPGIVEEHTDLVHIPQLAIRQDTYLPIKASNLDGLVRMVTTYKNSCEPIPPASDWMGALVETNEYKKILLEIDENGLALEAVKRGIEIFARPY